ncbi:hypothetical protein yaldo0001_40810, partial [Yersinia aldovae ATCC 35236]
MYLPDTYPLQDQRSSLCKTAHGDFVRLPDVTLDNA